jgi:hypothetical protein
MATISKTRKIARKSVRPASAVKPDKLLPYGIIPRALPAGVARVGDKPTLIAEFGKNADWDAVTVAYESRSL